MSVFCAVVLAALALAAIALAKLTTTDTSHAGNVSATFSFNGRPASASNLRLTITRAGRTVYDRPARSGRCGRHCSPGASGPNQSPVLVVDLEHNRAPDVVLELFSGGANCCFIDQVFRYSQARHTYVLTQHDFAFSGARLKFLGAPGRWRFLSADDGFRYLFTDGADSGEPIQIWSFAAGHFSDVTRKYRKLVAADAARWLRRFRHHLNNGVGLIAAWAADEEMLGHDARVQSTLATEARRGHLLDGKNGLATGQQFVAELNQYLVKLGYRH